MSTSPQTSTRKRKRGNDRKETQCTQTQSGQQREKRHIQTESVLFSDVFLFPAVEKGEKGVAEVLRCKTIVGSQLEFNKNTETMGSERDSSRKHIRAMR